MKGKQEKPAPWYVYICAILLLCLIIFGGPRLSRYYKERYQENVRKHGVSVRAMITGKNTHKGSTVKFSYFFRDRRFNNRESNPDLFDRYNEGDSVYILLDSTDPAKSFITE